MRPCAADPRPAHTHEPTCRIDLLTMLLTGHSANRQPASSFLMVMPPDRGLSSPAGGTADEIKALINGMIRRQPALKDAPEKFARSPCERPDQTRILWPPPCLQPAGTPQRLEIFLKWPARFSKRFKLIAARQVKKGLKNRPDQTLRLNAAPGLHRCWCAAPVLRLWPRQTSDSGPIRRPGIAAA